MSLTPDQIGLIIRIEGAGHKVSDHLDLLLPERVGLSDLARMCSRSRDTVRKYLYSRYQDGRDYFQEVRGGKIYIAREVALEIRRKYVK